MSRRAFGVGKKEIEEPVVNLTPLIDVVFVILIMFIVIAPLLNLDRVELAKAGKYSDGAVSIQEASPISIHVRRDNSVLFNNHVVNEKQLIEVLRGAKKHYPKERPQLFHDTEAHFGTYQMVKNAAEAAGFHQLDIVLKPG